MSGFGGFPEPEEILIRRPVLGGVALQYVGSANLETRQRADGFVHHDSTMIEDFPEFGGGLASLMCSQIDLSSHIDRIQGFPNVSTACRFSKLIRRAALRLSMASEAFPRLSTCLARKVGR